MNEKQLEEMNKKYFGYTMSGLISRLNNYTKRLWLAIDYINQNTKTSCINEQEFYAIQKLNTLNRILTGELNEQNME